VKALLLLLALTTVESPPVYNIYLADGTIEKKEWPKTHEECVARAKAIVPKGTCVTREVFTNTPTCEGVAKPVLPRELDADGYVIKPPLRAKQLSETDWTTELQDYVPAPAPTCWVLGWREITQADVDDDEYPDVAMMEPVIWPGDVVLP